MASIRRVLESGARGFICIEELIKVCVNGCERERPRGGDTVSDSDRAAVLPDNNDVFGGVKNFRCEFIFDPCHMSLAP